MKKFIHVLLPTGHLYEIPTSVIAANRAAHYHEQFKDSEFPTLESAMQDTEELFEDNFQVKDWALNNMNVDELMKDARLIRFTPPETDFDGGDWSYHDSPAIIPQLDHQSVLAMPVEMALSAMAAHRNICQVAVLNDDQKKPCAAIVLIQGGEAIVGTYVGALTHLTNTFVQPDPAANQH